MINQMATQQAAGRPLLNKAFRAQFEFIKSSDYTAGEKMPHEWGSLDSYDDMRAALRLATGLLDGILSGEPARDETVTLREIIRDTDGLAGQAPDVYDMAWSGWDPDRVDDFCLGES